MQHWCEQSMNSRSLGKKDFKLAREVRESGGEDRGKASAEQKGGNKAAWNRAGLGTGKEGGEIFQQQHLGRKACL